MSILENRLNYVRVKSSIWTFLKSDYVKRNLIFNVTFLFVFLKLLIFLGLTSSNDALVINVFYIIGNEVPIFVYLSFTGVFLSFAYLLKGRAQFIFLITFNFLMSALCIIDTWYYRGFGSFTTLHILKQAANLDNMGEGILSFVHLIDLVFIADIILLFFLMFKYRDIFKRGRRNILAFVLILSVSLGFIGYSHYWYDVLGHDPDWKRFFPKERSSNPKLTLFNLSFLGYHVYDVYAYYEESKPYILSNEEKKKIEDWFANKEKNLPDNKYKGLFKDKNLIIIQVESLENFVINQKEEGKQITPNLNGLLKNSLYFSNFYEQVNRGNSSDSDLLTNTSVYPLREGSTFFRYPENTYNSLPKLLKASGYYTAAIHPDKGGFWNWMPALESIGFDRCVDSSNFNVDESIGLGISDRSYFEQVLPILKELKQPFYSFMVTLSSHEPFELPKEYRELNLSENLEKTKIGGYFESIHYTDKQIGNFISNLDKEGLLDNSVVVIYGDHTGVHKYYGTEISNIEPSESWWYSGYDMIPLIIYSKGFEGEKIDIKGGQVDTMPTLLYLMGIDESKFDNTAMGRILLKTNKDFVVLSSGQYIGNTEKQDEEHAKEGLDVADKILRSNYFKGRVD